MMRGVCVVVVLLVAPRASAQSLNIDFGPATDAPSSSYAAAGLPGVWNSIEGQDSPMTTYPLVGLDGRPTGVTLYNIGGTDLVIGHDPSVSGDDAALMNDALVTYTSSLETCLFVNGLSPGTYEVTMYAWMPSAPAQRARVRHDLAMMTEDVGGAWPGSHVEGVTYARTTLAIGSDGFMGSHCGIVPGMDQALGAALNGLQLRQITCASGPCPDAGTTAVDAGVAPHDAGASHDASSAAVDARADAGTSTHGASSGCSCGVPRRSPDARGTLALAGAAFVGVAVRRRRG